MTQPLLTPIPVTILSGFLGSGKTTLLNNLLHGEHGLKIAVLVNDFGEINIDAQLIVGVEGETVSLSNGCICCSIRGDLIDAIVRMATRTDPPQHIVIETSGVSDPVAVAMSFRMPELQYFVSLDSIITVVDAENFLTLAGDDLRLGITQLEMADLVVLNKVDVVTVDYIQQVRDAITQYSPRARILEATYAAVPLEFVLGVGNFAPERLHTRIPHDIHVHAAPDQADDHHTHDHALVYSTWHWTSDQPMSLDQFREFVNNIPKTVYRAKGVIYLADIRDQQAIFHLVGKRAGLVLADTWTDTPRTQIVFIGSHDGIPVDTLRAMLENAIVV